MMNKGRKFFSILLILIILVTICLLGYLAYNYISNYISDKEASKAVDDFENIITVEIDDENNTNIEDINTGNTENTNTQTDANTSKSTKATYKGYNVIGTIQIPKTKVKYPIVDSTSPKAMEVAIVMIYGPGLNQEGNTVIVGHNYRNGSFFGSNRKLENGDKIYITDTTGNRVEYVIYNKYITTDSDFSYATRETGNKREISLSTCTSDSSKRLVIWAKEN